MSLSRLFLTAAFGLALLMAGCVTDSATPDATNPRLPTASGSAQLRPGDTLTVALTGVPDPANNTVQIDERGQISLPFIGTLTAGGLTTNELSQAIRQTYVDKKFYTELSISVTVTERFVYLGGEVLRPGRITWSPDLTLSKSIQAAGGFTLYAKKTRVTLTRDRKAYDFDVLRAQSKPDEDPVLFPGDSIQVPRSAF